MSSAQLLVALCVVLIVVIVFYVATSRHKEHLTAPEASIFIPTAADMMQLPAGYPKQPNTYYLKNSVPAGKHLPPGFYAIVGNIPGPFPSLSAFLSNMLRRMNKEVAKYEGEIAKMLSPKNKEYVNNMIKLNYGVPLISAAVNAVDYIVKAKILGYGYPNGYFRSDFERFTTSAIYPGLNYGPPLPTGKIWELAQMGVTGMTQMILAFGPGTMFINNKFQNTLSQLINMIKTTPLSAIPEAASVYTEAEYQQLLASFMPALEQCLAVLNKYGPIYKYGAL